MFCSTGPEARVFPEVWILHHTKNPGGKKCPLPQGFPCDCATKDVYGLHTCHLVHIISKVWGPMYEPGDAQILDLLRSHYNNEVLQLFAKFRVTPLFTSPCKGNVCIGFRFAQQSSPCLCLM